MTEKWNPNWKKPSRVWNPITEDGFVSYWLLIEDQSKMTLPEYIEGQARGTVKRMYGNGLYKLVKEPR